MFIQVHSLLDAVILTDISVFLPPMHMSFALPQLPNPDEVMLGAVADQVTERCVHHRCD